MLSQFFTDRLSLVPLEPSNSSMVKSIYAIQSDPKTWKHLPQGVETNQQQSKILCKEQADSWDKNGLGWWAIYLKNPINGVPKNTLVGLGGCGIRRPEIQSWNLGYRFTPKVWGNSLATELSCYSIDLAHSIIPQIPITARVLKHNIGSWRTLEKSGLSLIWEGTIEDKNLTSGLTRQIWADRPINKTLLNQIISLG